MVTAGAVWLAMVAVVRLGNGRFPPEWRGRYLPDGWHFPRPWKFSGPHGGAGESRGWLNSHEGEPWPTQVRGTRKGDAHLFRQGRWAKGGRLWAGSISTSMRVSPWKPAIVEMIDPLGLYHPPGLAGLRYLLAGPVGAVGAMPAKTSPIPEDPWPPACDFSHLPVCLSVVNWGEARKLTTAVWLMDPDGPATWLVTLEHSRSPSTQDDYSSYRWCQQHTGTVLLDYLLV